jgi:hypothetical protein
LLTALTITGSGRNFIHNRARNCSADGASLRQPGPSQLFWRLAPGTGYSPRVSRITRGPRIVDST